MARIEDYGLIGDLQTAALVGRDGSIDWACFPRFDSGACFAAILGDSGPWPLDRRAARRCLGGRPPLPPTHARARDGMGDGHGRGSCAGLHATAWESAGHRAHRRGRARPRRHGLGARHSLRLRRDDSLGQADRGRPHRGRGPGRAVLPHTGRAPRREHAHDRRVHGAERATAFRSRSRGIRRTSGRPARSMPSMRWTRR